MGTSMLRLRAALDNQFLLVVVALVVLAGLGGWVTYTTHVAPGTTTEQRPASSWETTGQFAHSATVQEDSEVFAEGQTLTNRSVYFTAVTPELDGTFRFTYDASASGNLTQSASVSLVIRGVDEGVDGENETVLWRSATSLNESTIEAADPGETVRVPFSVDVNDTVNRTETIHEQLGTSPGQTEVFVRAAVELRGTVNGNEVDRTKTYTLPLKIGGKSYSPGSTDPTTDRYETMRTVTVQQTHGPLRAVGGPALLGGAFIALGGLVTADHLGKLGLSREERERLEYTDDRAEFAEWISPMRLPEEAFDRPQADATSLGALVDFAIDTNSSVIDDPDRAGYYVLHEGYLYTYRPEIDRNWRAQERAEHDGHGESDSPTGLPPQAVIGQTQTDMGGDVSGPPDDGPIDDEG